MTDRVLLGGPIWTGTGHVDALAIRNGRVLAAGDAEGVRRAAGGEAELIDLEGRRAIPGLIDSHVHLLRAGLTWNDIVRWDRAGSLAEGLDLLRKAAGRMPSGTWLRVLGGWHPGRFAEGRGPTRAELDDVAPEHPVYVQLLYEEAVLNSAALAAVHFGDGDPPGGEVERDATGAPTGLIRGAGAFQHVLGTIPPADLDSQLASTVAFMADFNALGVTGAVDPGGFGVRPESYRALFEAWRRDSMTVRTRLYLVPGERGREMELIEEWVRYVQPGFGDEWLRYVGIGEILTFGCHDLEGVRPYPFEVTPQARRELLEISRLLARSGWPVHMHAVLDDTIGAVLDVWEQVDAEIGLGSRWSLAHVEPIGADNLRRVSGLGLGLGVQNRLMYRAADSAALWGDEVVADAPPLRDILDLGIPLGAGTDATVVSPHDPWLSIWWLVTGRSVDGAPPRAPRHRLSVEEALRAYTAGSAWIALDEHRSGRLAPGMLADVAVLTDDVFTIDEDAIPTLRSELTLVGGRAVYAGEAFSGMDA
jgi:predicted amidohydrolase YtcJ